MTKLNPPRRVVTGLDGDGRSCFLIDGPSPMVIWENTESPADNSGVADAGGGAFGFPAAGAQFIFSDFAPGTVSPAHTTDTIDYIVILSGECVIVTDTAETVLRAGDVFVDRGVSHAWRNDSDQPCRLVSVLCAARPLGAGATMTGSPTQS